MVVGWVPVVVVSVWVDCWVDSDEGAVVGEASGVGEGDGSEVG